MRERASGGQSSQRLLPDDEDNVPFPLRGALAATGGIERWEVADRQEERRWRQTEEVLETDLATEVERVRDELSKQARAPAASDTAISARSEQNHGAG